MQIEIVRADCPRKLAIDEFLIGGNGVDGDIERDDRARPAFRCGTQRKVGAARQPTAGRGMTRCLRKAGVRAHPYDRVDPMGRAIASMAARTTASESASCAAVIATANLSPAMRPQNTPAGSVSLIRLATATMSSSLPRTPCVAVIHAVQLDQRKGRALIVGALCERKIQELQRFL